MGASSSPTPITSGQEVSFDSTATDNYYSFTLTEAGNVLFAGSHASGYPLESVRIYDNNLNLIASRSNGISEPLQAGDYLIFPSGRYGGTFSVTSTVMADTTDASDTVAPFVNRLYINVLGRDSDTAGLEYWISDLESTTAADVAKLFYNSPEFLNARL